MDYSPYIFLGLGAAISVIGFFLKRLKEEIDVVKVRNQRLEVNQAKLFARLEMCEKLSEDRRSDVKEIFRKING
jgi:hypothetical protein